MANLLEILRAANMSFDDTVQTQVYLANLSDFSVMNDIYATHFVVPPARITIQAAKLPRNALIEIALIAHRSNQ